MKSIFNFGLFWLVTLTYESWAFEQELKPSKSCEKDCSICLKSWKLFPHPLQKTCTCSHIQPFQKKKNVKNATKPNKILPTIAYQDAPSLHSNIVVPKGYNYQQFLVWKEYLGWSKLISPPSISLLALHLKRIDCCHYYGKWRSF